MKITKGLVKDFLQTIPVEIHMNGNDIGVIGIRWGWGGKADELFGRKTILAILDKLDTDKKYQELLPV